MTAFRRYSPSSWLHRARDSCVWHDIASTNHEHEGASTLCLVSGEQPSRQALVVMHITASEPNSHEPHCLSAQSGSCAADAATLHGPLSCYRPGLSICRVRCSCRCKSGVLNLVSVQVTAFIHGHQHAKHSVNMQQVRPHAALLDS